MKAKILCLTVSLLVAATAFGQGSGPQWKTIKVIRLTDQSTVVRQVTLFTPTELGDYRVTGYIYGIGAPQNASWVGIFSWTDATGVAEVLDLFARFDSVTSLHDQVGPFPFSAAPGTPITFAVQQSLPHPVDTTYTLWLSVEQLLP